MVERQQFAPLFTVTSPESHWHAPFMERGVPATFPDGATPSHNKTPGVPPSLIAKNVASIG